MDLGPTEVSTSTVSVSELACSTGTARHTYHRVIAVAHLLRRQVPVFWGLRHTLRLYCLLPLSLPLPECLDPWCLHSLVRKLAEDAIGLAMCRDTESTASYGAVCCLPGATRAEYLSHARASGCHRSSLHRGLHVKDARPKARTG